jgi:hypothetical protein
MDERSRPSQEELRAALEQTRERQAQLRAAIAAGARSRGIGCVTTLFAMALVAIAATAIISPWAFYIGSRLTPLTNWEGYGKLHSSTGTDYGLFLHLGSYSRRRSRTNLRGFAALCTPQGVTYNYGLVGRIHDVWMFTEGKQTSLWLRTPKGEKPVRGFELRGKWQSGALVLSDAGSMGMAFHADGSLDAKGNYSRAPVKGEQAQATVVFGKRFDFDELCANEIAKGR